MPVEILLNTAVGVRQRDISNASRRRDSEHLYP